MCGGGPLKAEVSRRDRPAGQLPFYARTSTGSTGSPRPGRDNSCLLAAGHQCSTMPVAFLEIVNSASLERRSGQAYYRRQCMRANVLPQWRDSTEICCPLLLVGPRSAAPSAALRRVPGWSVVMLALVGCPTGKQNNLGSMSLPATHGHVHNRGFSNSLDGWSRFALIRSFSQGNRPPDGPKDEVAYRPASRH